MNFSLKANRDGSPPDRRRKFITSWLPRLAVVGVVVLAAHLDLRSWNAAIDWIFDRADAVEPLRTFAPPIVVERDGKPTVYLMTARRQVERQTRWWLRLLSGHTQLEVDLWAFDGATAQPRWHRRVLAQRGGSVSDMTVFGVQGETIWLYANGLRALHVGDATAPSDAAAGIQARNPPLAGKLVADPRYYGMDAAGLYLTDADARQWRIAAGDFSARPVGDTPASPRPDVVLPAVFTVSSPSSFKARGMDLGTQWLGLLSERERATLDSPPVVPGDRAGDRPSAMAQHMAVTHNVNYLEPLHSEQRYRLARARIEQVSNAPPEWPKDWDDNWGTRPVYSEYRFLSEAPDFLGAGLLDRGSGKEPFWLRQPDSVLVQHRDKLGEDGRLQLARIAGPGGRVVWNVALPLSLLQSTVVVGDNGILFGREYVPAGPGVVREPYHYAHERLVAVDLRDGTLQSFNISLDGPLLLDQAPDADP